MSGRVHGFHFQVAYHKGCAILQSNVIEFIFPTRTAFIREIEFGASEGSQLTGSRKEICMNMGFQHMGDGHVVLLCDVKVSIHIAFWIDDGGNTRFLTSDEITGLGKGFVVNVLKKHGLIFNIFKSYAVVFLTHLR